MNTNKYEISVWEDYQVHQYEVYTGYNSETQEYSGYIETITIKSNEILDTSSGYYYKPINQWYDEKCLAIIGSNTMTADCRASSPHFNKKSNGEFELTFILYTQYFDKEELEFLDNPFIKLLVNERKIKLHYKNKWYDFIIKNTQENSDAKSYTYTATALFINELSKNGLDLVFDPEKENSTGDIITLAQKTLEGTDWVVSDESELIRQTTIEPLYILQTNKSVTAANVLNHTETITIAAGQIIYGFYSCIENNELFFQFLYRQDGNYTIDTDTGAVNNSNNWFIDNTEYLNNSPTFCNNNATISLDYRGEKYIRNVLTEYDSRVDKVVTLYSDGAVDDKGNLINNIRGYTEYEYLSPTLVTNLVTNPDEFTDDIGWDKEGEASFLPAFYPSIDGLTGQELITQLNSSKLTLQANLKAGERIHNSGLLDNRKFFVKNGIAKDEQYVLRIKYNATGALKGFIAFYDGFTEDGKYNIRKDTNGNEIHIFDFVTKVTDTTREDYNIYVNKANVAVTYQEMLTGKLGLFLEASQDDNYIIESVYLFKYYTYINNNGEELIVHPETVPSNLINIIYYYYYDNLNKDAKTVEDIVFFYQGQKPKTNLITAYDEKCTKRRSLKISNSNRFNIIQELCELFECWADFVIEHNEDGTIVKDETGKQIKKIIFKNYIGKDNFAGFKYGINSKTIQRNVDSDQIVSKIVVEDNSNEYATDGACSISRAKDNPTGELFFYDFRHYYTQGLLNYSELMNDLYLYSDNLPWLGYYVQMKNENRKRDSLLDDAAALSTSMINLSASVQTYYLIYTEASEALNEKKQEFANYPVTQGTSYEDYINNNISEELQQIIDYDPEAVGMITAISILIKQMNTNKELYDKFKKSYDDAKEQYDKIQDELSTIKNNKELLNAAFYKKYSRFIQEGSWTSEDYIDDDLYYYDAASTLAQSAVPQVTYTINVIDVSSQEGFEGYTFEVGDKTYIEDTEFFGWTYINGVKTPVQESIVVSEFEASLDNEDENIIKVQNYKSRFEDLFQRISATTANLQYQSGSFARAAAVVTSTGEIKAETLQQSFANNAFVLSNAGDQTVQWDDNGIIVTSPRSPSQIVRIVNGGIYLTKDSGNTWSAAITGSGINASYINAGQIDTSLIRIMNGIWPTYRWDGNGLSAYNFGTDSSGNITTINYNKYVRFDQYGIYGINAEDGWIASSIDEVKRASNFALTWDGFILRNKYGAGYVEISSTDDFIVSDGTIQRIKIGNIGSTDFPIYGIKIANSDGESILETGDNGSLWLKNKLSIETYNNNIVSIGKIDTETTKDNAHGGRVIDANQKFVVYEDGYMKATGGYFEGTIKATDGYFSGEINATSGSIGGLTVESIKDTIVDTQDIKIESNYGYIFKVDNESNVSPISLNLTASGIGITIPASSTIWYGSSDFNTWIVLSTGLSYQLTYNSIKNSFVNDTYFIKVVSTVDEKTYTDFCTINRVIDGKNGEPGKPGKDGVVYTVNIVSSSGLIFKNNTGSTILTCYVYNGNTEITSGLTYQWKKGDTILIGQTNKTLEVSAEDVDTTQTYNCIVTLADV